MDASLMRYTMAAPADSTLATAPNCSARSRSSGPGTTTVKSACSRKWSIGRGNTLSIALTTSSGAAPASSVRIGVAIAPRPDDADRVRLRQQCAYGSGCSRAAQRGRRQIIARDAAVASTPAPGARSASVVEEQPPVQRRGGGVQRIRKRRIGFTVGTPTPDQARPARQVQPRRRQQMPLLRRRGFEESVGGHRRRPVRTRAVLRLRFRHARRDQPGRRGHLEDQPEPAVVDAGDLRQPFDVAHPEPAAAELGNRCGAEGFEHDLDLAQQVDRRACSHRVDIGGGRGRHHGVGCRQPDGSG